MKSQMSLRVENGDRFTIELNVESTISLIFIFLNVSSCLFVLSKLNSIRRKNEAKSLNIKHPFYFAVSYLMYSIAQIVNFLINRSSLSQPGILCGVLGKFSSTFLTMNLLLPSFLEFSTLSKINKKIDVETGKYDNYMWMGLFLLSWIATIFGINRYEQLELKYALRLDSGFEYHVNAILIFFVLLGAISYFSELRTILCKVISKELLNKKNENYDHMDPNVIRACLFSILPSLFQWSLILLYNVIKVFGIPNDLSLNIFLIIAVNIGGIGHAITYFIYERKYLSDNFTKLLSYSVPSYGTLPTDDQIIVKVTS